MSLGLPKWSMAWLCLFLFFLFPISGSSSKRRWFLTAQFPHFSDYVTSEWSVEE